MRIAIEVHDVVARLIVLILVVERLRITDVCTACERKELQRNFATHVLARKATCNCDLVAWAQFLARTAVRACAESALQCARRR